MTDPASFPKETRESEEMELSYAADLSAALHAGSKIGGSHSNGILYCPALCNFFTQSFPGTIAQGRSKGLGCCRICVQNTLYPEPAC
jgi:hypothetical protein